MPEIKNTFVQGKMNKDLDERLLPNGQYRDALNVEVSTSEDSDVGTVQNILGNYRLENLVDHGFICVGSIADEKTNRLYWFVSRYDVDAILEYNIETEAVIPVLVDANAGNYKAVLKFSGNIITGINIIDNLLFWTDNNSEPHKINIDECKRGTEPDAFFAGNNSVFKHTQLVFDNGSFNGLTINKVATFEQITDNLNFLEKSPLFGKYFYAAPIPFLKAVGNIDDNGQDVTGANFDLSTTYIFSVRHYRDGEFLGIKEIRYFGITSEEAAADANFGGDNNGTHARLSNLPEATDTDWKKGDVIFGIDRTIDIEERHITVIKPKPLNALSVKINHAETDGSTSTVPNLFETKFPRFSYRYKYRDGEYSPFAPFTAAVFNAKYPKDTNLTDDSSSFYDKDNIYTIKEPFNKAMINSIHSVDLGDFINAQTPEDVVEVDILYKQEESNVIYSIDTIKQIDAAWHLESATQGSNVGYNKAFENDLYSTKGGLTKGRYLVTTENIYAALPANQLLRPYDNVPKKALAQEITGNRIVYGNYVQNYDLVNEAKVSVSYSSRKNSIGSFATRGLPSIKSQRNYQVGVVYCDKFGRETPVFTSKTAAVNVPWQNSSGKKNASKSNQLNASVANNFPEWVDSLKFFVKETSNPYYNLTMERAWVTKSTYDLDNSEGNIWISFPSSDRNKISEDDYIVLKKKIGVGEEQVNFENKYKVIDISNEAPDAIKYRLSNLGTTGNGSDKLTDSSWSGIYDSLFPNSSNARIDVVGTDALKIDAEHWIKGGAFRVPLIKSQDSGHVSSSANESDALLNDLYVSWARNIAGDRASSKKYKVKGGWKGTTHYNLKLESPIEQKDADIAHKDGTASTGTVTGDMFGDLIFQIEQRELIEDEDFSGKFFVKISKNQVTGIIETNSGQNIQNAINPDNRFEIKSKNLAYHWHDEVGSSHKTANANYGITNSSGHANNRTGTDSILNISNNSLGAVNAEKHIDNDNSVNGGVGRVSDYAEIWAGIKTSIGTNDQYSNATALFFHDAMHMVAGQSDASNYAKYCNVIWSGTDDKNPNIPDGSCWSYPPVKTWLTDYGSTLNLIKPGSDGESITTALDDGGNTLSIATPNFPAQSVYYENNLITTNPLDIAVANNDYQGLKVDGWVGPLQNVTRKEPTNFVAASHINGLEGVVQETNSYHITGPRRWFSGMDGVTYGNGEDTKTYGDKAGKHFIHLSFFAPGKNLHNGDWTGLAAPEIYGPGSWAANLQGIWGGGVFTGKSPDEKFGVPTTGLDEDKFFHLPMEGNNDTNGTFHLEAPGPGVGYGYDIKYRELHERQWDPTFSSSLATGGPHKRRIKELRDFIRNLYPGSQFRFNTLRSGIGGGEAGQVIYTIKKVQVKKLYNHTSWRKTFNRFMDDTIRYIGTPESSEPNTFTTDHIAYQSVEEVGLRWLNQLDETGVGVGNTEVDDFKKKIEDFGKAHNRRLCYIIELDKKVDFPTDGGITGVSADQINQNFSDIEFIDPIEEFNLRDLNKFPAIWELSPKKADVDLDIYYEASGSIPVKLNEKTNELFAPIGCTVDILNSNIASTSYVEFWDGNVAKLYPGFPKGDDDGNEINYTSMSFKFTRQDGSYTIAEAGLQDLDGNVDGLKTHFTFREDIGNVITHGLNWYNCFSFGNGLESNRIRDGFNEIFISNGVKASTVIQEAYEEERRRNGLIYSGIYNSNSGVNDLNQFIQAEKITKDLNPTYGSIQKLFSRNTDLVTLCEDKVVKVLANKDAVFNADGNPQLTANENVLGQTIPFIGEYGISKNPESFASESYRAYFTDKQRGAVLRLSKDGLTPISSAGMKDWFRDNLPEYNILLGTYDSYKEDYNITLSNNSSFNENLILDSYLETGIEIDDTLEIGGGNKIENPGVFNATPLQYLWENTDVLVNDITSPFTWNNGASPAFPDNTINFTGTAQVINHGPIGIGDLQEYIPQGTAIYGDIFVGAGDEVPFALAVYNTWNGSAPGNSSYPSGGGLSDGGWWYDPRLTNVAGDLFGANATNLADAQVYSEIIRAVGYQIDDPSDNNYTYDPFTSPYWSYSPAAGYSPEVEKPIEYFLGSFNNFNRISQVITRDDGTGTNSPAFGGSLPGGKQGAIAFDRVNMTAGTGANFVEFKNIGNSAFFPTGAGVNQAYIDNGGTADVAQKHSAFFNGDELHVQVELTCFTTATSFFTDNPGDNWKRYGYNFIKPKLILWDSANNQAVSSSKLVTGISSQGAGAYEPYSRIQTTAGDFGNEFNDEGTFGGTYFDVSIGAANIPNGDHHYHGGYSGSSTVIFPNTSDITEATAVNSGSMKSFTVICGASFKFRDPNQQDSSGAYIGGGDGIQEVKVVDNLSIRITNDLPNGSGYEVGNANAQATYGNPLNNQLWEINELLCRKGFGVVEPYTEFVPETQTLVVGGGALITPASPEVDAVPAVAVPAWTQVIHANNNGFGSGSWYFIKNGGSSTGSHIYQTAALNSALGGTYDAVVQSGVAADGSQLQWVEPGVAPVDQGYYPNGFGNFTPPVGSIPGGANFQATKQKALNSNFGTPNTITYNASSANFPNSIIVGNPNNGYNFIKKHLNEDYDLNSWYLVDVEYDESWLNANSNVVTIDAIGNFTGGGYLGLPWHGSPSGFTAAGDEIDPNGVGVYRGDASNTHIGLIPVTRTEYGGPPKTVLRAIYQIAPDSQLIQNNYAGGPSKFTLMSNGIIDGIKIDKIIVKKLNQGGDWINWLNTSGVQVNDWTLQSGDASSPYAPHHAFSKRRIYQYNGKLCWEVPAGENSNISTQDDYHWKQDFGLFPPAIASSDTGWELSFTVSKNPKTNNAFTGSLRGFAAIEDLGGAPNNYEGVYFKDISHVGDYLIKFNFDGSNSVSNWTFERRDDDITSATYNTYIDYTVTGTVQEASTLPAVEAICKNKLYFSPVVGNPNPNAQEYAISNIKLTDSMPIFSGGSAGSWSFDGFNTSLYNYIFWDQLSLNINFNECPVADPTINELKFININQQIDKTINKGEKYEISFTHGITAGSTAKLSVYYYNTDGFGFKIKDIDHNTAGYTGNISIDANGDLQYEFPNADPFVETITIGDSMWSNINDDYPTYNADLKNSFVIQLQGDPNDLSLGLVGYIDNITMVQVFNGTDFEGTTVSFNENVKGWTSFKSFVPDNGVSLSKKYFTFKDGGLYQHYIPLKKDINNNFTNGYSDNNDFIKWTPKEAENYNVFYNKELEIENAFSKITTVLNQEPSVVKMFNTINYEGSQTYVVAPTNSNEITLNNAIAWSNGEDIKGWMCAEIKTDLDSGSVREFIKKEGKWFNYIKGLNTDLDAIDTSLFSTQGIGIISAVQDITQFDPDTGEEIILGGGVNIDPDQEPGNPNTPMPDGAGGGGNGGNGGY